MDPYRQHLDYWPECHNRRIVAIADALVPALRPEYEVAIEKRIYEVERVSGGSGLLVSIPDVTVKQGSRSQTQTASLPTMDSASASALQTQICDRLDITPADLRKL